jgi:hypothetical protein
VSEVVPPRLTYARSKFRVAVHILDGPGGALKERLAEASRRILALPLDDLPPLLAADYVSLRHRLSWRGTLDGVPGAEATLEQMDDLDAEATARLIRELYVNLLAIAPAGSDNFSGLEK